MGDRQAITAGRREPDHLPLARRHAGCKEIEGFETRVDSRRFGDAEAGMRVAVIGTGGIGGPYGAALAKAGADVTFVARGAHLAAIRENGLRIEGDRGETTVRPAQVTDDIAAIGAVDFVLSCVKLWDVEDVGERLRAIIGPQTAVIPLQNGVDAAERLTRILGRDPVMGGMAFVTGTIIAPGVVRQTGTYQQMTFGELDGRISERGRRLQAFCEAAGFEGVLSPDIMVPIWQKFVLLVPLSGLNALTRLPLGKWRNDPDLLALYNAALNETVAVGLAEGVKLPPDSVEKALAMMRSMPPHHTTSMGNDLLRGNRLELPWFAGKVVELGRRHGIPTPVNGFIYSALKLYVNGVPN
jgi:2-dehydropantoate 2-reductase